MKKPYRIATDDKRLKKAYAIAIGVLVLLLTLGVFRGQWSRELILLKDGSPLANVDAEILPCWGTGSRDLILTSTDANGKLDLSEVPSGAEMIVIEMREHGVLVFNGDITLPSRGTRTIDIRGKQSSASTTTRTYFDLWLFKYTVREAVEWRADVDKPASATGGQPAMDETPATHE